MKALGQILLYLAATVLIGALLAPPLYWMAHALAAHVHSAGLADFVDKTDFQRYFHRAIMVAALVLLWPLEHALGIRSFESMGLRRDRWGWHRLAAGFLIALVPILILGGVLVWTDVFKMHSGMQWGKMAWVPVTAVVVSVLEEFLFRGALQGAVRKTTMDGFALVSVAVLFAVVHFLTPHGADPAAVEWYSGLALLPDALWKFGEPAMLLGGFSTMLIVGLVLGYARVRTKSLWMSVGLHVGWVLGKMELGLMTRQHVAWPWVGGGTEGPDILVGLGPLIAVLAAWGIVAWLLREVR